MFGKVSYYWTEDLWELMSVVAPIVFDFSFFCKVFCFVDDDVHWEGMCSSSSSIREVQLFSVACSNPCCLELLHKRTTTTHGDEEEEWWSLGEIEQP